MSAAHHGNDDRKRVDEIIRRFVAQGDGAADRAYPEGRIGAHDEGELAYAVGVDERHRVVVLHFNKPVAWLGLGPEDTVKLAECLIEKARALGATVSPRL